MKRFFSRFSTPGPTSPTKQLHDATLDPSEKKDLSAPTPTPATLAPYHSIGRTKALVAKFERLPPPLPVESHHSANETPVAPIAPQITIPNHLAGLSISDVSSYPSNTAPPSVIVASVPKRLPGSSLPIEPSHRPKEAVLGSGVDSTTLPTTDHDKSQRQASGGSQTASSSTHASKTVAFAPSPQKQRSTSPAHISQFQRLAASQPLSRSSSAESNPLAGGSNFARPTAASQARSRTWTRSAASDASQLVPPTTSHSLREKGTQSTSRSSRPNNAPSNRSAARRSFSYASETASRDVDPSALASVSSSAGKRTSEVLPSVARRTSLDIAFSGRSSPNKGTMASGAAPGPLQFPSRTSLSMRLSYSGSASSRPTSRRNSADPASPTGSNEPVVFPPAGAFTTRSFGFPTWSEMTHQELVRNLGPRERTRQEVLWEIVASEERYVTELEKAKEIYIDALLDPELFDPGRLQSVSSTPVTSSPVDDNLSRNWAQSNLASENPSAPKLAAPDSSSGNLPIAARFMSNAPASKGDATDVEHAASARNPDSMGTSSGFLRNHMASRSRPGSSRTDATFGLGLGLGTTATRDRSAAAYMSAPVAAQGKGKASKAHKLRGLSRKTNGDADSLRLSVPLPPSLREVLIAISYGLVEAHGLLSDALKARYEEQWPLVRSLADVFMRYSHILEHYASYVCHLQRAMEELEEAALMERAFRGKRLKKERLSNTVGLGRTVAALEACAADQGYAGLSIFASMPFQRLLKYPLLFQNLLFHTDPSTHEFESTVAIVVEVERLVRSIEDEKVNAEERDKTRDVFARIDGITDRQLLRPRPDRMLIEEQPLYDENARRTLSESAPKDGNTYISDSEGGESGTESSRPSSNHRNSSNQPGLRAALRNKRSYRRLSDFLSSEGAGSGSSKAPTMGSKKDLWLVRFSDVEIKCQRIGVTALPMVSTAALRNVDDAAECEASDFAARSKDSRERLKALRNTTLRAKTRNLYKFISVVAWRNAAAREMSAGKDGYVDGLPTSHEVDEEDGDDDDDAASLSSADGSSASCTSSSDSGDGVGGQAGSEKYIRSTKLSFTYWGDRIEPSRAIVEGQASTNANSQSKASAGHRPSRRSDGRVSGSSMARTAASMDSAVTSSTGALATSDTTLGKKQHRRTTLTGVPANLPSSTGRRGMSGRLSEPLAATSMSTAPEAMQTAVAQMHARQRNEKFGARLRTSTATGTNGNAVMEEASGSHVSVHLTGADRASGASTAAGHRKSITASSIGRAI
ncbi:hypothetical protein EX895_003381 [Sporisorium graminicola]|uniref:DH domain-containing protein n=1 Tax=Sporisorium graminicola TaxID=280036 RepID=A0A4U7KTH5_9BASI|nr:hypothetical protein EX895_003381 [Sporisorium graminicola]TKY87800.1 hypothetical protein EX895_003381 [Sporisorium graminicola]